MNRYLSQELPGPGVSHTEFLARQLSYKYFIAGLLAIPCSAGLLFLGLAAGFGQMPGLSSVLVVAAFALPPGLLIYSLVLAIKPVLRRRSLSQDRLWLPWWSMLTIIVLISGASYLIYLGIEELTYSPKPTALREDVSKSEK